MTIEISETYVPIEGYHLMVKNTFAEGYKSIRHKTTYRDGNYSQDLTSFIKPVENGFMVVLGGYRGEGLGGHCIFDELDTACQYSHEWLFPDDPSKQLERFRRLTFNLTEALRLIRIFADKESFEICKSEDKFGVGASMLTINDLERPRGEFLSYISDSEDQPMDPDFVENVVENYARFFGVSVSCIFAFRNYLMQGHESTLFDKCAAWVSLNDGFGKSLDMGDAQ